MDTILILLNLGPKYHQARISHYNYINFTVSKYIPIRRHHATISLSPLALAHEDAIAQLLCAYRLLLARGRLSAGESRAILPALAGRWQQRPGRSRPPSSPAARLLLGAITLTVVSLTCGLISTRE